MTGDLLDDARMRIQSTYNEPCQRKYPSTARAGGYSSGVTSENTVTRRRVLLDSKVYSPQ